MKDTETNGETLIRVRLKGGRYEALLTAQAATGIEAVHDGTVVALAELAQDARQPGTWSVALDLPAQVIGEGVQVIALRSTATGDVLDRLTLISGAPLDEDLRAEVALLRDELEMLKRAFRRHCNDTAGR